MKIVWKIGHGALTGINFSAALNLSSAEKIGKI
jgi:hypothetical protein